MTIYFDMDGTIANLYGVSGWLNYLESEDTTPYESAPVLLNMSRLARAIHKAQSNGYEVGIISWTSRNGSYFYNRSVATAKREWLSRHLPSVQFDEIIIIPYGTPKQNYADLGDILFDDEEPNRTAWGANAYEPCDIFSVLASL